MTTKWIHHVTDLVNRHNDYHALNGAHTRVSKVANQVISSLRTKLTDEQWVRHIQPTIEVISSTSATLSILKEEVNKGLLTAFDASRRLEKAHEAIHTAIGNLITQPGTAGERLALLGMQEAVLLSINKLSRKPQVAGQGTSPPPRRDQASRIPTVNVATDVMSTWPRMLFPPERMALVTGHRVNGAIMLSSTFDITGTGPNTHAAHCQSDKNKLAQALIRMENAGGFVALWVHSHPGKGAMCTHPSSIDVQQQKEWLENYPDELVAAIVTQDGYIRFWGPAVENNLVQLKLVGDGVSKEAKNVYHVDF